MFRGCSRGVREYYGVFRVYFVSETAQVELQKWKSVSPCLGGRGGRRGRRPNLGLAPPVVQVIHAGQQLLARR